MGDDPIEDELKKLVDLIFLSPWPDKRPLFLDSGSDSLVFPSRVGSKDISPEDREYSKARDKIKHLINPVLDQSFDDIIGNEEALSLLKDAIQSPVLKKELYESYCIKPPKGALISGPPGCGKTMFARAAANEMKRLYGDGVEFLSFAGSEIQSSFVGQTEKLIIDIFKFARIYKKIKGHPLLIFIDEADAIFPDRKGRIRRVAPWEESQVATFLSEMDGIQENGAFVLLATNRPEVIDSAILRDGRCDFKITIQKPSREAVEAIIRKNFNKKVPLSKDTTLGDLVFTAVESLYDPHKVIVSMHGLGADIQKQEKILEKHNDFCLEHILSGAMAASIPRRASMIAFSRDKQSGCLSGVTTADVIKAVSIVFEENKNLDHSFYLKQFLDQFKKDLMSETEKAVNKSNKNLN